MSGQGLKKQSVLVRLGEYFENFINAYSMKRIIYNKCVMMLFIDGSLST